MVLSVDLDNIPTCPSSHLQLASANLTTADRHMFKTVVKMMLAKSRISSSATMKQTLPSDASYLIPDSDKEDEARPSRDGLTGAMEAGGDETATEDNYNKDYLDGSSFVVTVKKVKAKPLPTTLGELLGVHVQRLSAACGDLVCLKERGLPYELFDRDADKLLLSYDREDIYDPCQCPKENEGQCTVCLKDNTQLTRRHHFRVLSKAQNSTVFGRIFVHARAAVLQTQTILDGTATNATDGGFRRDSKASKAYPTNSKDDPDRGKMLKQAELLVQKPKGDDEREGDVESPSKRMKKNPATNTSKSASLMNMACMSATGKHATSMPAAKIPKKQWGKK
ncbi:hypothetical protein BDK51DRAFT_28881 [Blyttiomyces helicus]|uniref:Uncharacterized protein n=1 Tax=Blyttiomyces helicus TaxID=388810 RepID=A0A4P9WQS5_9FUNG|nr:hypothetical protein BDK51DRAFT_28881 [Blyttiomyces helicus]|eukprot:RKO93236.1 hypothetical protein BDK51DRAFT_28881 [Blyttiomyces helicus]